MAFNLPQVPFKLTPQDMGATDLTEALTKGINLGYLPREKETALKGALADNIYKNLVNQYYGRDKESEIGYRDAQTGLTKEQTKYYGPNIQSEMALRKSQGGLADVQTQFYPLESYTKAATALRANSKAERASDFIKGVMAMPVAERGAYIAQHRQEYDQYLSDLASGNNVTGSGGTQQNPLEAILMNEIRKQGGMQLAGGGNQPSFNPAQMNQQPPAQPQQGQVQGSQQPNQAAPSPVQNAVVNSLPVEDRPASNDPDIKAVQDKLNQVKFASNANQSQQMADFGTLNSINKLSSPQMKNRVDGAKVLEIFLKEMRTPENMERFLNVAKQAGQMSQAERMVQSHLPENMQSQSYKDYLWYTDTFQKAVTSTVKQMEKLNGDKKQIQMLQELTGMLYSPQLGEKGALKNFNESIRTLQKMSSSIFDAAEPKYAKGIHKRMYDIPGEYDNYVSKNPTKMATIIDPEGGEHKVPEDKVEEAIKLHPGTKLKGK